MMAPFGPHGDEAVSGGPSGYLDNDAGDTAPEPG